MTRQEIITAAKDCVCGQREQDYGKPENSFTTIGIMWGAYLREACGANIAVNAIRPEDVAAMMALLKIARVAGARGENTAPTDDTWVDIAGYAACGGELTGGMPCG